MDSEKHEECQYLELIEKVIETGSFRIDRTKIGTYSLFGLSSRYSLKESFPLLTTKNTWFTGIVKELLWFISGSTNAQDLSNSGVKIWDQNAADYASKHPDCIPGELGPIYGFQWLHSGANYIDCKTDYTGQGINQLQTVIDLIKTDPYSRRIIISSWNPGDLSKVALPWCHAFCQFYVHDGYLSCSMYQRSCDLGLGVPFNIASYALLTYMIAQVCDLKPFELIHNMGDAHVYQNHVKPLKEQLTRQPYPFPTLILNPEIKRIEDFKFDDIKLVGYKSHPRIAMEMAV